MALIWVNHKMHKWKTPMPLNHLENTKEVLESMADIVRSFVAMEDPSTPYF
jgi:hypothetical protein